MNKNFNKKRNIDKANLIAERTYLDNKEGLELREIKENIFNTPQMGGILTNPSDKHEEDKRAVKDVQAAIQNGMSEDEAIELVANKYKFYTDYLKRKYILMTQSLRK